MAKIFVSYSRKNIDFAKRLTGVLQEREMDFWVDWEGIPPTVDWMQQIQKGIEEADTFLFIISPDSVKSKVCKEEIGIAVKNGKRLIPVVVKDVAWDETPPELSHLNYIFFRESDDFDAALSKLLTAIDTDYGWVQTHRRLQVKALEWERGNKDSGFLLRGKDLEDAEQQISIHATTNPLPTDIQREYVLKSRQETDRQSRIRTTSLSAAVIVMLGIIVALIYPSIAEWIAKGQARGEILMMSSGDFYMGATDPLVVATGERAEWLASLPTFYVEKYEVTNRQYGLCVKHGGCTPPGNLKYFQDPDKQEYPVLQVNVYQASTYCQWIGRRLPTALEWIRTARGLNDRRLWPWGDIPPTSELTNMPFDLSNMDTSPQLVTGYPKNISPEGVQNLIGNALEWTSSYYQENYYYGNAPYDDKNYWDGQVNTYDGNKEFIRLGGGWQRPISHLAEIASFKGYNTDENTGIRCASR
jgi:formylglycine-generating enzyme required for sulfatase activity